MFHDVLKKGSVWGLFLWSLFLVSPALGGGCHIDVSSALPPGFERVEVKQVLDGDTLLLRDERRVRMIGINTPELAHHGRSLEPLAVAAQKRLRQLLRVSASDTSSREQKLSAIVKIGEDPKDRYGRALGHVFSSEGVNITELLLRDGHGFQVAIPPNTWGEACYSLAEREARLRRVGVWQHTYFAPKDARSAITSGGYQRIIGTIERLFVSRNVIWIDLNGDVTLKLDRRDAASQKGRVLRSILEAHDAGDLSVIPALVARGWLMDRREWGRTMVEKIDQGKRKRWLLNVRHRTQWRFVDNEM